MKIEIEKVENGYIVNRQYEGFRQWMVAETFESLVLVIRKEFESKIKKK